MGRFVFRFNTILNAKEKLEEDKKNKLGLSMKKLSESQDQLNILEDKKHEILKEWQENSGENVIKISDFRNFSNQLNIMDEFIQKQTQVVECCEIEADEKRKELIAVSKEKKTFEKLKEKDYEEFKYIELKKEHELVDELISYKASNR